MTLVLLSYILSIVVVFISLLSVLNVIIISKLSIPKGKVKKKIDFNYFMFFGQLLYS